MQVMIFLNVLIAFLVDAYQVNMDQLIEQKKNKDREVCGRGEAEVLEVNTPTRAFYCRNAKSEKNHANAYLQSPEPTDRSLTQIQLRSLSGACG